jgi:intron-binding protein aquarius
MPNTKRLKGGNAAKAAQPSRPKPETADDRPTPAELEEEEHAFVQLARKTWLKPGKKASTPKVKADVLKQGIWEVLERDGFSYKALRLLESLQVLESYLWPGYTDDASNFHVLLIAMVVNVKRREHLETWSTFDLYRPGEHS